MISHRIKLAQILFGPSDSAKEDYLLCACRFFESYKKNVEIVNLDPCSELNNNLFSSDIRYNIETPYEIGNCSTIAEFTVESLNTALKDPDWIVSTFEGNETKYFIINATTSIDITMCSNQYDILVKSLLDLNFRIVFVNIFPANQITTPNTLMSAKLSILSMLFSLDCGNLPFINIFTDYSTLNEEKSEQFDNMLSSDNSNRDEFLSSVEVPVEMGGINNAICDVLSDSGNYSTFHKLDTEDDDLVKSFFSHLDDMFEFDFINETSSDDEAKPKPSHHTDLDDEEEEQLFDVIKGIIPDN